MKRNWTILIVSALAANSPYGSDATRDTSLFTTGRLPTHVCGNHATILTVAASTDAAQPMLD